MKNFSKLLSGCAVLAIGTSAAIAQHHGQGNGGGGYQGGASGYGSHGPSSRDGWRGQHAPGPQFSRGGTDGGYRSRGGGYGAYGGRAALSHSYGYRGGPSYSHGGWRSAPAYGYYGGYSYPYPYDYYVPPVATYYAPPVYDYAYYEPRIYYAPEYVVPAPRPAPPPPPPAPVYAPAPLAQAAPAPQPAPQPRAQRLERYTLSARELFDFDRSVLKSPQPKLDEIAFALNENPRISNVHVSGFTDRLGSDAYNKRLSQKRAEAVKNYLVGKGVDANRLIAIGRGEGEPIVFCTDKKREDLIKCLEPNRRVEVEQITVERSH